VKIRSTLFATATFFVGAACLTLVSPARAQSDLPQFSDPYGGATAYVHTGETPAAPKLKKAAPRKLAKKSKKEDAAHTDATASQDAAAPPPVATGKPANPAASDNPVSFGMKWSGSNGPTFSTNSSTIPAVNEIKRNANEDPVETGNGVQAGVNLKF
jgi:hypothetical protein